MKIAIGTDIIEIERIKKIIESKKEKFLDSMYTEKEREYCESKNVQKYQSYAARFAAKEAIYKALSNYINFEYSWKDFEILNAENGKPEVNLHFKISGLEDLEISISHCKQYAVAYVTALFKE
jgi:holo-[acyl-carrier-protein] synthase